MIQTFIGVSASAVIAIGAWAVAPDLYKQYFPPTPWVEFKEKTVIPDQNGFRVAYQFVKHRDCPAHALYYFVDERGSDFTEHRGEVVASMNGYDPGDDVQVLSVTLKRPDGLSGDVGYKVELVPDDPSCGPVAHAGIAWLR